MNKIIKIFTRILMIIAFASSTISATNYYFSSSGNDSNSGTSTSSPWISISKINNIKLIPGDKILFKRAEKFIGKFDISESGVRNNFIYFGAYGEGTAPIIDGTNTEQYLVQISQNVSYLFFEGLNFRDCNPDFSGGTRGIIYANVNANNIIFNNCVFRQTIVQQNPNFAAIYAKDPSYITIDSCDFSGASQMIHFRSNISNHHDVHHILITHNNFHDINTRMFNGKEFDGGSKCIRMSMSYPDGVGNILGEEGIHRDITISDNTFYKLSGIAIFHEDTRDTKNTNVDFPSGIPIWLTSGKTSYNIFILRNHVKLVEWCFIDWGRITNRGGQFSWSSCSENIIDSCGFDIEARPTTRYPTNAINTHAWKQVIIEKNIISNVATNSGDGKGIILDFSTNSKIFRCDSTVVRGNIISGTGVNSKLDYAGGIHMSSAERCSVYNNVCFNNKAGISVERETSSNNFICNNTLDNNYYGFYSGSATGTFINNAVTNNNLGIRYNSNFTYSNNGFFNNADNYSSQISKSNDVIGNPFYSSLSTHDYSLTENSNFVGKGIDLGIFNDIVNTPRINNIDIGAYQYKSNDTQEILLNLKVFLEGPFIDGKMNDIYSKNGLLPAKDPYTNSAIASYIPPNIVDWILVEILSDTSKKSKLGSTVGFLRSDGKIVDVDGKNNLKIFNINPGFYYVVIKHRNHLSIMSSIAIELSNNSPEYDFTNNINKAFGKNAMSNLGKGIFGMYSGDSDSNGIINIEDYKNVGNCIFKSGYEPGDLDMNSIINIKDYEKSSINIFKSSNIY